MPRKTKTAPTASPAPTPPAAPAPHPPPSGTQVKAGAPAAAEREAFCIGLPTFANAAGLADFAKLLGASIVIDVRARIPSRGVSSVATITAALDAVGIAYAAPAAGADALDVAGAAQRVLVFSEKRPACKSPARLAVGDAHHGAGWVVRHVYREGNVPPPDFTVVDHDDLVGAIESSDSGGDEEYEAVFADAFFV